MNSRIHRPQASAGDPSVGGCRDTYSVRQMLDGRWAPGYRELPAPAGAGEAIVCLWIGVTPPGPVGSTTDVLPDGCTDLIWQQGLGAFVAGPDTGPASAVTPPDTVLVGLRFRPGAGGPALRIPLVQLRDQRVDLPELDPWLARRLPAEISPEESFARMKEIARQLACDTPPDRLVRQATALMAAGQVSVAELARSVAVSERQLLRRFDAAVGYGPKTLHRVIRFRRALDALSAGGQFVDLAVLADRTGYADQAHLTREVTRMAGRPPAALARRSAFS